MYGVVLWSDQIKNRAVIWCEDHGDLAFFNGDGVAALDAVEFDPGDLVQFDIKQDCKVRLARNPRLVASDEYPTLARDLKSAGQAPAKAWDATRTAGAKIIPFERKPDMPGRVPVSSQKAV